MSVLKDREILLGVTGGIACYKAVEVLRGLKRAGAQVSVVMTQSAQEFVRPLTFQTLSNRPVGTNLFDLDQESNIGHIRLAEQAELALVAPTTANMVAKLRAGLADDLLSTILLATTAPILLALAMNDNMLLNAATQENLEVLRQRGLGIIPPGMGFLAEGKEAVGRLADPDDIVTRVEAHFAALATGASKGDPLPSIQGRLQGRKVLVTAGPTVEHIDPVRYLTNRSSGRMGYALAEACRDAGAEVLLISGPTNLPRPFGVTLKQVVNAEEMRGVVLEHEPRQDVMIFAAAVSDYRIKKPFEQKIKRAGQEALNLELVMNDDIAKEAGKRKRPGQVCVVFAAESQDMLENARKKLESKNADLVVANDITEPGSGFDSHNNRVTLVPRYSNGHSGEEMTPLPLMDKRKVAIHITATVADLLAGGAGLLGGTPKPR